MKLIKVAFNVDVAWIGGINYYRSLLLAISRVPSRQIEPVILVGKKSNLEILADFPQFEIIRTSILDRFSFGWFVNKFLGGNYLINLLLKKNGVQVFSHTLYGGNGLIKTIGWIPDFQHTYFPNFFSKRELDARNKQFMYIAKKCDGVVLSSQDAYHDFVKFAPEFEAKARVLRFTSVPSLKDIKKIGWLEKKYEFNRPYFYLPNQFWIHKNHNIVIDAVSKLRISNPYLLVITTGNTFDCRHPNYFGELMDRVRELNISENFRVLGVIPYSDVVGLMMNSIAVVNPSLFEGWSTTVEEAKSLGVPLLLSDIPVHLEQAKDVAIFFSARDSGDLAKKMDEVPNTKTISNSNITVEKMKSNSDRMRDFGVVYQNIVLEVVAK